MKPLHAVCSVVNRSYVEGFKVVLKSLLEHHPDLDIPYIVFDRDLSKRQRASLAKIYPSLEFRPIPIAEYSVSTRALPSTQKRLYDAFYKFEAFGLVEFDRVLLLDTDMIVLREVSMLFEGAHPLMAREGINAPGFNTGVVSIGKEFLNAETRGMLIKGIETHSGHFADQDVLSSLLGAQVHYIPEEYNVVKKRVPDVSLSNVRILHYTGRNPWNARKPDALDQIWIDYHKRHFKKKWFFFR